ncbi:nascent polypeptide-associated complex subunit alpha, muscle-specific form isoform X2 [Perca flavescens]|uniref:nascent polypeptide-associated complex subunit alpha, muscle-specific form isoform X2 n=1 Tax=Perca flavescens TaxID=8167 RepID=UPI00106DDCFF|nr:nascent polypeptide-associated complex subunit alpha, muscle-specific form-like isoform X2 [Perca flavescens]
MAYRESRGSRILLSLGLLVFASSFCHCTKLTKLKALDELRENSTLGKSQAKAGDLRYGRLLIGQNSLPDDKLNGTKATKNFWDVDTDYQEDMGWGNPEQLQRLGYGFSKPDNAAVERLLLMDPKVECTGDSMKLQVQNAASTPGSLFFVDRGSLMSPLALSKLPPSCGYNIRSTRRDLVLVAPYDGCFVVLEEDSYVLPIRWLGLNVRMSCPLMPSSPNPPMVTCHAEGMVVKTGWTVSIAEININLNGNWEPLMKASSRCGFSVVVHPEGVVISVHYTPCMEIKDGMYTLELAGEGETKMSCPPLPWPPASGAPQQQPFYPQLEAEKQTAEPRPVWTKAPQGKVQPPFYLYPFYPQPVTEKPTAAPRPPQTEAPQGPVQPLFYPQPETEKPTAAPRPPQTKAPQGKVQPPFYLYPFYPQPVTEKPTADPRPPQTEAPQGPVQPPFYPQPETEKPTAAPRPPQTKAPQGQVRLPFYPYPFYPQPETEKPTADPRPPQTEAPQGPVQTLFYPQPETEKPTADPRPPQTKAPQGKVQPPFYLYPFYPQPVTEKPTADPRPPQTEAPQGQVRLPFYPYPFYPQPETEKPTADPRPPQTEAPQGPVQPPFYPQPETEKPTAAPRPPQTKAPQGKVQPPFYLYPFYPQPETEKPTAAPRPPQTKAPQGQVRLQFYPYPFYPQPETEKPTADPRPPQTKAPQGKVQPPFYLYPFYPQPETEKPTADPRPPQTEAPQGPVQPPFYPQPETEKPTAAPRPPQTKAPQGKVQPPFYLYPFYPQPETEKPTAAQRPPQTKAPQGQVRLPFYPYPFYPQPETEKPTADPRPPQTEAPQGPVQTLFYPQPETEKPTADPRPPQTKAPQGKVQPPFYLYPFYPQPVTEKPTADPRPPQTEAPQGQVRLPFYPYPFYPQPETEKPTADPRPPQTEAPQGPVQPLFYPQPETEKPTAAPRPPQTKAPQGQVRLPFYPFYPQPETEKPTADPRPPQTEAPQGPVQPLFYPQPETEKPTAAPRPPQTKAPQGKVQPPFYLYPQPVTEKPTAAPRPPQTKAPQGKVQPPFYIYHFYPQPETEKPVTSPPATTMQQPQPVITLTSEQPPLESDFPQPSNSDVVPQDPQQGSPYMRPVSCPQFCLSGISNCCPQIAFHQHHHHIIPSGLGSKDAPSLYPGLPFPQLAYSGFHSSLDSGPLPQKPTKMMMQATPTATIAQSQYLPYPQPPDGNPAILNYPSKPARFEQPLYPFVPNSLYPYWQYLPQNEALQRLPQSQSPAHYNVHSKRHTPGSEPVNPVLQYNKPSPMQQNGQLAWDINNSSGPDFMSHIGKYLNQQQNTPKAGELQQSNEASKSRLMHPKVKSETDRPLVPYNMLQDAKAQTYDKLTPNNASQPEDQQTVHSYVEPKSYVLLQHGPPDRGSNHSNESPLPSRDLVYDADLKAQNLARHHSSKLQDSQNVKPPQNPQHPKMLGQEMSHPLLDVNYIPRPDDKSSLPFISLDDPHSVPLPQDPFVNGAHLNPKFKDFWRPMTPLGSSQSIEPHVLVKAFQQSSAADQQADGLNQPNQPILQRGGNQRQK